MPTGRLDGAYVLNAGDEVIEGGGYDGNRRVSLLGPIIRVWRNPRTPLDEALMSWRRQSVRTGVRFNLQATRRLPSLAE